MTKLDQTEIKKHAKTYWTRESIPLHQVAVYTMCGDGLLGRFAAEQPAVFYIDDRVGRLPYSKPAICQAARTLASLAEAHGLNSKDLPRMPSMHNFGIF
jgi:hypothetical protein